MNETVDPAEVRRQRLLREMLGGARDERRAGLVDAFAVAAMLLLAALVVADAESGRAQPPPAAAAARPLTPAALQPARLVTDRPPAASSVAAVPESKTHPANP